MFLRRYLLLSLLKWIDNLLLSLLAKRFCLMERKNLYLWDKSETILLFYQKKSMHFILSDKILWSKVPTPFKDLLKSYQNNFHFQHSLKLCQLTEKTLICKTICSKTWLVNIKQFISLKTSLILNMNWFSFDLWY